MTDSSQEEAQNSRSYPQGDLESPFLQEELFVGKPEVVWEARVAALETDTPFAGGLMEGLGSAVQSEYEEEEGTSREVEAPFAYEELEEREEEDIETFERDVDTSAGLDAAREVEESEGTGGEFVAFEEEGSDETLTIAYETESSNDLSHEDAVKQALEEPLPQLFDAERPEPEEEVDEEAELPTDPADGWVVPEDVRRAGEAQTIAYDDAPSWDESRRNCAGRLSEGARVLRGYLLDNFPGIREVGGYNCRQNSASPTKLSVHGTGRALDIMIPTVGGRANSTIGDPIGNWLVVNASAIGIQYLIWNRVRWSGGRRKEKFARYTGPNPHRDHVHVELNLDGARRSTPWFAGRAAPAAVAPVDTVDYDKAQRLNRLYGRQLGWQHRANDLVRLLGLRSYAPEERNFVDAVARWQRQQSLGVDGILGPRTWEKMQSVLTVPSVSDPPSVTRVVPADGPVQAGGSPSSLLNQIPGRLGTLVFQRGDQTIFRQEFTPDDLVWTARLITGEASARDDLENRAVIAAMLNRYALFTHRVYPTFSSFLRAYSTPLQRPLSNKNVAKHYMNDPRFVRLGGTYPGSDNIPRGQLKQHLDLQVTLWERLTPVARKIAIEALTGRMPDSGIGLASEFASTWILYGRRVGADNRTEAGWLKYTQEFKRDKGWRWIGNKTNLDQKRNAFYLDPRAANLPPNSVQVLPPA